MLIIEQIHGNIITVEDNDIHFDITANMVTTKCREGDVLVQNEDGTYSADTNATKLRRAEILKLQDEMFE